MEQGEINMGILSFVKKLFGMGDGARSDSGNGRGNGKPREGDRVLVCVECKKNFIFEAGEQKFYKMRGLSEPKRCHGCRNRGKRRRR